jgi:hypothetical protein
MILYGSQPSQPIMARATITATIARIDRMFDPDPTAIVWAKGRTLDGRTIAGLHVHNDGSGPLVWPGISNATDLPLLRSIAIDTSMLA